MHYKPTVCWDSGQREVRLLQSSATQRERLAAETVEQREDRRQGANSLVKPLPLLLFDVHIATRRDST